MVGGGRREVEGEVGNPKQWAIETVGDRNSGRSKQWAIETVGDRNSGRSKQWAIETVGNLKQ
jgi:hypothetical protein